MSRLCLGAGLELEGTGDGSTTADDRSASEENSSSEVHWQKVLLTDPFDGPVGFKLPSPKPSEDTCCVSKPVLAQYKPKHPTVTLSHMQTHTPDGHRRWTEGQHMCPKGSWLLNKEVIG